MDILSDLKARLAPLGVPVLMPEQFREPELYSARTDAGHVKPDGKRGLSAYLTAHPEGYVQLHSPQGSFSSAAQDLSLVALDCLHVSRIGAEQLADAVSAAVRSRPHRPTPHLLSSPATVSEINSGAWRAQLIFRTAVLNG